MNLFIGKKKKSASPATLTAWLMIAYVLLNNREGEHIYRFGDESRLAAEQDIEEYKLFTCNTARVFTTRSAEDKAALLTATVVNSGDSRFAELDGSTCQPATILFRRQSRRSDGPWSMTVAGALLAVTGLAVGAAMAERE